MSRVVLHAGTIEGWDSRIGYDVVLGVGIHSGLACWIRFAGRNVAWSGAFFPGGGIKGVGSIWRVSDFWRSNCGNLIYFF